MAEWRLFPKDTVPVFTTPEWYVHRERAKHLEQVGHKERLLLAAEFVRDAASLFVYPTVSVADLGAGDGGLLSLIDVDRGIECWGYDLSPEAVAGARVRNVDVRMADVVAHPERVRWGDIAVVTELLEHLVDPHAFVREITKHSRVIVASSPYLENDGFFYPFHTWAWDEVGYEALFEQANVSVIRHETVAGSQVILGVGP